jgi:hypothetical protein
MQATQLPLPLQFGSVNVVTRVSTSAPASAASAATAPASGRATAADRAAAKRRTRAAFTAMWRDFPYVPAFQAAR